MKLKPIFETVRTQDGRAIAQIERKPVMARPNIMGQVKPVPLTETP